MLNLILLFLLIFAVLSVLLGVGTVWFQGYIYSEPVEQVFWRAPTAALALTLFMAFWSFLEAKNPTRFETLFNFSPRDDRSWDEFLAIKGQEKVVYRKRKDSRGHVVYKDESGRDLMTHPDAIIVKDDGTDITFKAEKDEKGRYKIETGQSLRLLDEQGRVMTEDQPGLVSRFRWSLLFVNVFVNFLFLVVWFLTVWLLLRFQWTHALGLAVFFWLTVILTMMPMLLIRARGDSVSTPAERAAMDSRPAGSLHPVQI